MATNHGRMTASITPRAVVQGTIEPKVFLSGSIQIGNGGSGSAGMIIRTKEEWNSMPSLMSIRGCIYVYSNYRVEIDPETHEEILYPGTKIGDGSTYLIDLPFSTIPITEEDIAKWNDHIGVIVDENENSLVFYH